MEKKEENHKRAWWMVGVAFFIKVSGYIIGPVLVALFLGKYLDKKFDTEPWAFLSLTILAFVISSVAIVRSALKFIDKEKK